MPYESVGALGSMAARKCWLSFKWRVLEGDALERQSLEWGTY